MNRREIIRLAPLGLLGITDAYNNNKIAPDVLANPSSWDIYCSEASLVFVDKLWEELYINTSKKATNICFNQHNQPMGVGEQYPHLDKRCIIGFTHKMPCGDYVQVTWRQSKVPKNMARIWFDASLVRTNSGELRWVDATQT